MAPPPGSTPMKKPRKDPRNTGAQHCRQSWRLGSKPFERRFEDFPVFRGLQVAQDLGKAEETHDHHHEIDAVRQPADTQSEPRGSVNGIEADGSQKKAQDAHHEPLQDRFFGQIDRHHQTEKDQTEVFGRAEFQGKGGQVSGPSSIRRGWQGCRR